MARPQARFCPQRWRRGGSRPPGAAGATCRGLPRPLQLVLLAPHRHHHRSQGFIAMVMLVLFTLILGSLAIVSRTSSGRLAAAAQGRNREARDVAEAGITEIISELNKEPNRRLLVSGVALASWSQGATDFSNPLINPCTSYNSSGNAATLTPPTTKAIAFKNGWQALLSGDPRRSYRLVSVTYSDVARNPLSAPPPTAVTTGQVKSLLRLTVEGRMHDAAGNALSSARVIKEFEVVPKCCKRSFGRNSFAATNFGEDNRFCFAGGSSAQNADDAVAAVVGGLSGGTINSSNNTLSIVDENLEPITRVLCRSNVPAPDSTNPACIARSMTLGVISVVPSFFNLPVPPWPGSSDTTFSVLDAPSKAGLYVRVNPSTNVVERCSLANNTLSDCQALSSCTRIQGIATYISGHYCRISRVDADKETVVFDTSNAPLFLYFDTPASPAALGIRYISYQGNGSVRQVRCAAGSLGPCSTDAGIGDVERLNVYAYGTGSMNLNGADSVVTMNIFAPKASFEIRGGGSVPFNFIGRLWLNNIYANGSTRMQVLESAPQQLVSQGSCTLTGCAGIGPDTGASSGRTSGTPDVDWVARSVTYSSAF